jgi:hypothetical protein
VVSNNTDQYLKKKLMKKIILITVLVTVLSNFASAIGTKTGGWQIYFADGWYSFGWCQNGDKPSGVRTWSGTNTTFTGQGGSFSASWTAAGFNWIPDISKGGDGFGPIKPMVKNWNVQWDGTGNIQGNGTTYTFGLKFNAANFNGYKDYNMTESYECYIITSTNKTASQLDGTWFADVYPEGDPVGYQLRKAKVNWGNGDFIQLWAFRKQYSFSGPVNVQAILQAWSDKSGTSFKTDTWYMPGGVSIMNECFGTSGRFDLTNIQIPSFNTYLPLPHTEVVTSRGETLPSNGSAKANDGISTTTWVDPSPTTWLTYGYITASKNNTYTITTGTNVAKDPKSWTIQASTDGTTWVTLDTQTNQAFAARSTTYKYSFANETGHTYYKIDITANNGNASTEIAELNYSYVDEIKPTTPTNVTFSNATFTLSWTASTDNHGKVTYEIFNNGISIGNSLSNSFVVSGIKSETEYNFTVKASDAAQNWSDFSTTLTTTTGIFTQFEAENAITSGGGLNTNHPGYSGTGFWDNVGTVSNYIEFTINSKSGGSTDITCRYSSGDSNKTMTMYVNGVKYKVLTFPSTKGWDNWASSVENVNLNAGNNTIKYQYDKGNTGYINVDYIQIATTTGISTSEQVNEPIVFPNPASGQINIRNIPKNSVISIFCSDGKLMNQSLSKSGELSIVTSGWSKGLYFVSVKNENTFNTLKFVVK